MKEKGTIPPNIQTSDAQGGMVMSKFRRTSDVIMGAVSHRGGKTVVAKVEGMFRKSQGYSLPGYDAWKTSGPSEGPADLFHQLEDSTDDDVWNWLMERRGGRVEALMGELAENGVSPEEARAFIIEKNREAYEESVAEEFDEDPRY